jgi:uncharacterized protein
VGELASRIAENPDHFQDIYYRVDLEPFKSWQILYLNELELIDLNEKMDTHANLIKGFAEDPELLSFLKYLNQEMASRMVGELFTGFLDEGESKQGKKEPFDLSFLIASLEGMTSYLHDDSPSFKSPWSSFLKGSSWDPDLEGYFWEANKRYLIAFVTPRKSEGEMIRTLDSLDQLRKYIREIQTSLTDVKAGVTGRERSLYLPNIFP